MYACTMHHACIHRNMYIVYVSIIIEITNSTSQKLKIFMVNILEH